MSGKSKAAFGVYAANTCGTSEVAREVPLKTGTSFEVTINTILTNYIRPNFSIDESVNLYGFAKSLAGAEVSYQSLTPSNCTIDQNLILSFQSPGKCQLAASVSDVYAYKNPGPLELIFLVTSIKTVTCKKGKTIKKVKGVNPKCPTGYKKA